MYMYGGSYYPTGANMHMAYGRFYNGFNQPSNYVTNHEIMPNVPIVHYQPLDYILNHNVTYGAAREYQPVTQDTSYGTVSPDPAHYLQPNTSYQRRLLNTQGSTNAEYLANPVPNFQTHETTMHLAYGNTIDGFGQPDRSGSDFHPEFHYVQPPMYYCIGGTWYNAASFDRSYSPAESWPSSPASTDTWISSSPEPMFYPQDDGLITSGMQYDNYPGNNIFNHYPPTYGVIDPFYTTFGESSDLINPVSSQYFPQMQENLSLNDSHIAVPEDTSNGAKSIVEDETLQDIPNSGQLADAIEVDPYVDDVSEENNSKEYSVVDDKLKINPNICYFEGLSQATNELISATERLKKFFNERSSNNGKNLRKEPDGESKQDEHNGNIQADLMALKDMPDAPSHSLEEHIPQPGGCLVAHPSSNNARLSKNLTGNTESCSDYSGDSDHDYIDVEAPTQSNSLKNDGDKTREDRVESEEILRSLCDDDDYKVTNHLHKMIAGDLNKRARIDKSNDIKNKGQDGLDDNDSVDETCHFKAAVIAEPSITLPERKSSEHAASSVADVTRNPLGSTFCKRFGAHDTEESEEACNVHSIVFGDPTEPAQRTFGINGCSYFSGRDAAANFESQDCFKPEVADEKKCSLSGNTENDVFLELGSKTDSSCGIAEKSKAPTRSEYEMDYESVRQQRALTTGPRNFSQLPRCYDSNESPTDIWGMDPSFPDWNEFGKRHNSKKTDPQTYEQGTSSEIQSDRRKVQQNEGTVGRAVFMSGTNGKGNSNGKVKGILNDRKLCLDTHDSQKPTDSSYLCKKRNFGGPAGPAEREPHETILNPGNGSSEPCLYQDSLKSTGSGTSEVNRMGASKCSENKLLGFQFHRPYGQKKNEQEDASLGKKLQLNREKVENEAKAAARSINEAYMALKPITPSKRIQHLGYALRRNNLKVNQIMKRIRSIEQIMEDEEKVSSEYINEALKLKPNTLTELLQFLQDILRRKEEETDNLIATYELELKCPLSEKFQRFRNRFPPHKEKVTEKADEIRELNTDVKKSVLFNSFHRRGPALKNQNATPYNAPGQMTDTNGLRDDVKEQHKPAVQRQNTSDCHEESLKGIKSEKTLEPLSRKQLLNELKEFRMRHCRHGRANKVSKTGKQSESVDEKAQKNCNSQNGKTDAMHLQANAQKPINENHEKSEEIVNAEKSGKGETSNDKGVKLQELDYEKGEEPDGETCIELGLNDPNEICKRDPPQSILDCHKEFLKGIKSPKTLELLNSKEFIDELKKYDMQKSRNADANKMATDVVLKCDSDDRSCSSNFPTNYASVDFKTRKNGYVKRWKGYDICSDIKANALTSISKNHDNSQELGNANKTGKQETSNDKVVKLPELGCYKTEEVDGEKCIELKDPNESLVMSPKKSESEHDNKPLLNSFEEIDDSIPSLRMRSKTEHDASFDETALNPIGNPDDNKTSPFLSELEITEPGPCGSEAIGNSATNETIPVDENLQEATSIYDSLTFISQRPTLPEDKRGREKETEISFPVYMKLFFKDDRSTLETLANMFEWILEGDGVISTNDENLLTMINMKIEDFLATSAEDENNDKLILLKTIAASLKIQVNIFPLALKNGDLSMSRIIRVSFPEKCADLTAPDTAQCKAAEEELFYPDTEDGAKRNPVFQDFLKRYSSELTDDFESNLEGDSENDLKHSRNLTITTPEKETTELDKKIMESLWQIMKRDAQQFLIGDWQMIDPLLTTMKAIEKMVVTLTAKEIVLILRLKSKITNFLATTGKFSDQEKEKLLKLKTTAMNILTKGKKASSRQSLRSEKHLSTKNSGFHKHPGTVSAEAASRSRPSTIKDLRKMEERMGNIARNLKIMGKDLNSLKKIPGISPSGMRSRHGIDKPTNVVLMTCADQIMKRFLKSDRVVIDMVLKLFEKVESKEGILVAEDKDFLKMVDGQIEVFLLTNKDDAEKFKLLKLRAIVSYLDKKQKEDRRSKMQGGQYEEN